MHSARKQERLREFEDLCRRRGLPLTIQRRTVLEVVLDRGDHPTADRMFDAVRERLPNISRTTVYRVLDTLVRVGVITKVCHPGTAVRFDAKTQQHHHLVCMHCDRIVDLEDERLNSLALPDIDARGFEIREYHIHFRGICRECRRKLGRGGPAARKAGKRGAGTPGRGKTGRQSGKRRTKP